jgi:site-specific DNA-methyltransferase (adenine-specific)
MIQPYYRDEWVTIYNADCRDVLPQLPKVDLVLTDPPYGMDYQSCRRVDWQRKTKIEGDKNFPLWIFDIFKPTVALMIFCRWDNLYEIPKPKSFIVWDKVVHSMGDLNHEYGRQWEGVAFYSQTDHEFNYRPKDIIRCMRIAPNKLMHPNEKPVELMSQLIQPNKCNLVLDPFMGVAPVLLASKISGRKSIGIEIDEKYCELAAKRCQQTVMNFDIQPKVQNIKQGNLI